MAASPDLLFLVRHAESTVDPSTSPVEWDLTAQGSLDAAALGNYLQRSRIVVGLSSAELKASETARIVASALGVRTEIVEGFGEQGGRHPQWVDGEDEFLKLVEGAFARPEEEVIGDESMNAAVERFDSAIRPWLGHRGNVMVVSHGRVLSGFVAKHEGIDAFEFWRGLALPSVITLTKPDLRLVEAINEF